MEKILEQQENETVITNPRERFRTFFRKLVYRNARWIDALRRLFTHQRDEHRQ
jgi:hypothetical protein